MRAPSLRLAASLAYLAAILIGGCRPAMDSSHPSIPDSPIPDGRDPDAPDSGAPTAGRGFPELPTNAAWVAFYGPAQGMGDLARVASRFRVIDIDADPGTGNFTPGQILELKAGGKNRIISYFNLGSCEHFRSYWAEVPPGFVSCGANTAAQRGSYNGYPDEVWMDVGNADYQQLLIDYVAPRLAAQGVDGFFFDNFEIVEHGATAGSGACDARCQQGGLDLVRRLRERFPDLLFVMQNATSEITRHGRTGEVDFPTLLDGISHEEVYAPVVDEGAEIELLAWATLGLRPNRHAFWIATEDYVGSCDARQAALADYQQSRVHGFHPYATDQSAGQFVICDWPF